MAVQLPLAGTKYLPAQLELLGDESELSLTPDRLVGEIQCIVQLRNADDLFAGAYVYSVSIQDPPLLALEDLPIDQLSEASQCEIRRGYLLHESLYQLPPQHQETVLRGILAQAKIVDVSLTPRQGASCGHKIVKLRAVHQ